MALGSESVPRGSLHFHALLFGVLPPFSSFLGAVLLHYQIHAFHLDPRSLVLLSAFAFLCEAFVGVTPSMALLRHLFSLELVCEVHCSRCASLKAANATVPVALYAELLLEAEGFQR
ncbi:erythrocyte binding protein-like [Hordeum vulgare]|nr:erythrocyte binding protein-like [Hordeum vulgare]